MKPTAAAYNNLKTKTRQAKNRKWKKIIRLEKSVELNTTTHRVPDWTTQSGTTGTISGKNVRKPAKFKLNVHTYKVACLKHWEFLDTILNTAAAYRSTANYKDDDDDDDDFHVFANNKQTGKRVNIDLMRCDKMYTHTYINMKCLYMCIYMYNHAAWLHFGMLSLSSKQTIKLLTHKLLQFLFLYCWCCCSCFYYIS